MAKSIFVNKINPSISSHVSQCINLRIYCISLKNGRIECIPYSSRAKIPHGLYGRCTRIFASISLCYLNTHSNCPCASSRRAIKIETSEQPVSAFLSPYLQKVMRAYFRRDVRRQPIPQGVGTVLKPPERLELVTVPLCPRVAVQPPESPVLLDETDGEALP